MKSPETPRQGPRRADSAASDTRRARQAEALRRNLRRRKAGVRKGDSPEEHVEGSAPVKQDP